MNDLRFLKWQWHLSERLKKPHDPVSVQGGGERGYGGSRFDSRSGGYNGSRDYYNSR